MGIGNLAGGLPLAVDPRKLVQRQVNLPAELDHVRNGIGRTIRRNSTHFPRERSDRKDIGRDVVTPDPVPARDGPDEPAPFIRHADGHAIELGFDDAGDVAAAQLAHQSRVK